MFSGKNHEGIQIFWSGKTKRQVRLLLHLMFMFFITFRIFSTHHTSTLQQFFLYSCRRNVHHLHTCSINVKPLRTDWSPFSAKVEQYNISNKSIPIFTPTDTWSLMSLNSNLELNSILGDDRPKNLWQLYLSWPS